ncbi:MAG: dTMP kinase [Ponticaulis sp.]|nr:dTMP kinase [Ponticaulis sp.]
MSSLPRFISFEGGEGVGKTTLLRNLERRFIERGQHVHCTREPGGTPIAEQLRGVLLSSGNADAALSPMTEALIISAARRDHVDLVIKPKLAEGFWVLCDRFTDSTRAYQGEKLTDADLTDLERCATAGLEPGLTILLDAPPEKLIERRISRGETTDRFEKRPMAFHNAVREAFLKLAQNHPTRILVIDALQTPEMIEMQVWEEVESRFLSSSQNVRQPGLAR